MNDCNSYTVYYTTTATGSTQAIIEESNLREFIFVVLNIGGSISKIVKNQP